MGNHPFNVVVVLFWLATMSWLVVGKILPPLHIGEPPSYSSILHDSQDEVPVCWSIHLQDQTVGWAATKIVPRKDGVADLYSRVFVHDLPLEGIAPAWLGPVLRSLGPMDIEKRSRVTIDPLGRLVSFESRVCVANIVDAIKIQGQLEGALLKLAVQSGQVSGKVETYLGPDALLTDELSPQARLPGLRVGQTWTVPLYSPFRPPSSSTPMEILHASVDREDRITWDGRSLYCHVIVYRDDPGSGLTGDETRGRTWVRYDGVVLRQEVTIARSRLNFIRLPDRQAEEICESLGEDWSGVLPRHLGKRLLEVIDRVQLEEEPAPIEP